MRRLIVDGYNLLHCAPRYAALLARDVDAARDRLIADLGARAASDEHVTVVFDGAGNPASDGTPHEIGGVTVVFSPAGREADAVVESLAAEARDAGVQALVVTSDGATRWTSLGGSVSVVRSETFAHELAQDDADWREHAGRRRTGTLADRMDPATRDRLSRMSRGEHA